MMTVVNLLLNYASEHHYCSKELLTPESTCQPVLVLEE